MKTSKKVKLIGSISELENLLNSQMSVVKGGEMPDICYECTLCVTCIVCQRRE